MKRDTRVPIPFTDERGDACLQVPLDDHGELHAQVLEEDYRRLVEEYQVTPVWGTTPNGSGRRYVVFASLRLPNEDRGMIPVGRLIMKAPARSRVHYVRKGETLDLRRSNLELRKGGGRAKYDAVERVVSANAKRRAQATAEGASLH
jgi:hypothetical protein